MSTEADPRSEAGAVVGFDHVALPMRSTEAMVASFRSSGLLVSESPSAVQVRVDDQMIGVHRPELWQQEVRLCATSAVPPCGDRRLVWRPDGNLLEFINYQDELKEHARVS